MTELREIADDVPRPELDRSLFRGVAWAGIARIVSQTAAWAVTIVVARILRPVDYGIVASATVFLGFVRLLTEFGLGSAIVALRDIDSKQIGQIGGLATILASASWAIMWLIAPLVATALGVAELRAIVPILGLGTALSIVGSIPVALLQRTLSFRRISELELARALVASLSLLILALSGSGYWSLVLSEVISIAAHTLLLLYFAPFSPSIPNLRSIAPTLVFSSNVILGRMFWYAYSSADQLILSRRLGATAVGSYSMALTLVQLPAQKVTSLILGIMPGVFASVRDKPEELRRYLLRTTEILAIVLFPASVGIALVSGDLIPLVLGAQWSASVPVLRALAFFIAIRSVMPMFSQVLIARNRAGVAMWYSLLGALTLPPLFYLASSRGMVEVALVWSVCFPVLAFFQARSACAEISMPIGALLQVLAPPALATIVMGVAVTGVQVALSDSSHSLRLICSVGTGALCYSIAAWFTMRSTLAALISRLSRGRLKIADENRTLA